jgi:septum formation topological specificity factor MinE
MAAAIDIELKINHHISQCDVKHCYLRNAKTKKKPYSLYEFLGRRSSDDNACTDQVMVILLIHDKKHTKQNDDPTCECIRCERVPCTHELLKSERMRPSPLLFFLKYRTFLSDPKDPFFQLLEAGINPNERHIAVTNRPDHNYEDEDDDDDDDDSYKYMEFDGFHGMTVFQMFISFIEIIGWEYSRQYVVFHHVFDLLVAFLRHGADCHVPMLGDEYSLYKMKKWNVLQMLKRKRLPGSVSHETYIAHHRVQLNRLRKRVLRIITKYIHVRSVFTNITIRLRRRKMDKVICDTLDFMPREIAMLITEYCF